MVNFLMSVMLTTVLFLAFKLFARLGVDKFQGIVFNYWASAITGILFFGMWDKIVILDWSERWIRYSFVLGSFFISALYLIAYTTQYVGMTIAGVASKISLILPVFFSLYVFEIEGKHLDILNYVGILLVILAIIFTSFQSEKRKLSSIQWKTILLPVAVFLSSGAVDVGINYLNLQFSQEVNMVLVSVFTLGSAAVLGSLILCWKIFFKRERLLFKNIIGGVALGIPNFFSLYFVLLTLSDFGNNGAFLFPVFNVAVILATAFCAVIFFREKLSAINQVGIVFAVVALFLIAYQEIIAFVMG